MFPLLSAVRAVSGNHTCSEELQTSSAWQCYIHCSRHMLLLLSFFFQHDGILPREERKRWIILTKKMGGKLAYHISLCTTSIERQVKFKQKKIPLIHIRTMLQNTTKWALSCSIWQHYWYVTVVQFQTGHSDFLLTTNNFHHLWFTNTKSSKDKHEGTQHQN